MDENFLERADELNRSEIEAGIARARNRQAVRPADFDGTCTCGDDIDKARVALGYYRCVRCQTRLEKMFPGRR